MMPRFLPLALVLAIGCESSSLTSAESDRIITVDGPLTLTVSDFPASAGTVEVAPTAEGSRGAVSARATRFGSLCALAVSARAEVSANRITLHIAFGHRLTICTDELRALKYDAELRGLAPGRYEVRIRHDEGVGTGETEVRVQSVDVT